jgi:hypothetical protein
MERKFGHTIHEADRKVLLKIAEAWLVCAKNAENNTPQQERANAKCEIDIP